MDGWLSVGFLGVFCSGLAYIFWYDALKALPAAQAGAFLYLEPFVTVIVAALILGEPLLGISLLGGAAILLGVWIVKPAENLGASYSLFSSLNCASMPFLWYIISSISEIVRVITYTLCIVLHRSPNHQ